jgi:hypothetical protein
MIIVHVTCDLARHADSRPVPLVQAVRPASTSAVKDVAGGQGNFTGANTFGFPEEVSEQVALARGLLVGSKQDGEALDPGALRLR